MLLSEKFSQVREVVHTIPMSVENRRAAVDILAMVPHEVDKITRPSKVSVHKWFEDHAGEQIKTLQWTFNDLDTIKRVWMPEVRTLKIRNKSSVQLNDSIVMTGEYQPIHIRETAIALEWERGVVIYCI